MFRISLRDSVLVLISPVIAMVLIFALTGYSLWQSRSNLQQEAIRNVDNLSSTLERYVYSAIHESDLILQLDTDEFRRSIAVAPISVPAYSAILEKHRQRLPQLASLRATDAKGMLRYGAGIDPANPISLADREHFKLAKDNPNLIIATPVLARSSNRWVLPITRRLETADHRFDGVIVANIEASYFSDLFASLDTGSHGTVLLFNPETQIFIRHPEPKGAGSAIGLKIGSPQFKALWQQGKRSGAYRAQSTTDGVWRTYSYRQVGDYPLYIMVGLSEDDYLAPWNTEAIVAAIALTLLSLLVSLLTLSLWRSMHTQREAYRQLAENQNTLKTSELRYRTVADFTSDWEFWVMPDGSFPYISPSCETISGYPPDEFRADAGLLVRIIHPDDRHIYEGHTHKLSTQGLPEPIDFRIITKSGESRWIAHICRQVHDSSGQVLGHRASNRDITERKQIEAMLRTERNFFHAVIDTANVLVVVINRNGEIIRFNRAAEEFTGYSFAEVENHPFFWDRFLLPEQRQGVHAIFAEVRQGRVKPSYENYWINRTGQKTLFAWTNSLHYDDAGQVEFLVTIGTNISERKAMEEQVRQLALHDSLTGLPNRRLLTDRLGQAMSASKRNDCFGAVLFLDLDNFKPLNDTFGHAVGDLLLIEAANRLTSCVREIDTVARVGGDEFVVVLSELSADKSESTSQTRAVAEKILENLSEPYRLQVRVEGQADSVVEHHCTASIGIRLFIGQEIGQEQLLKCADEAMYQAKAAGRNQILFSQADCCTG